MSKYCRVIKSDSFPDFRQIGFGDIHIWRIEISAFHSLLCKLEDLLAPDERAGASRFHFFGDRANFVIVRGILRIILARYLNEIPRGLTFSYGPQGRPELAVYSSNMSFSVSHSGGRALVAICKEAEIGVDLEKINLDLAPQSLFDILSKNEQLALAGVECSKLPQALFKCWVSKEAYIKGIGLGLSAPLKDFDVCVDPEKPARLLRPLDITRNSWFLHSINEGDRYAAAVATLYQHARLFVFDSWDITLGNSVMPLSDAS